MTGRVMCVNWKTLLERGVILCKGSYDLVPDTGFNSLSTSSSGKNLSLEEIERAHIISILDMTGRKVRGRNVAAAVSHIHPNTLYSRMKKLGISNSNQSVK